MRATFRLATPADHRPLEALVLASFEPITWQKKLDQRVGSLNGCDWQARWQTRLARIFATQLVMVGECDGQLAGMASATVEREPALGYIDVLCVGKEFQGQGLGRELLRAMIEYLRVDGCRYVNLDCLDDNEGGNALYRSEGFEEVARHIRWFKMI